jgi:small multidrug resistance pump
MTGLIFLFLAIGCEVAATSALKATEGFTRLGPSVLVVAGYVLAFFSLSQSLRAIPMGVAYATWAGLGTTCVALAGWYLYEESLNVPSVAGIVLIILGVGLLSMYSQAH